MLKCIIYLIILGVLSFLIGRIIPKSIFDYSKFPFRCFAFEKNGRIYEHIGIRKWKDSFPDMSKIFPKIIPPKKLVGRLTADTAALMICETCIAEFTHFILIILGAGCVFISDGFISVIIGVLYAAGKLPYIIIQRYNRPKLILIMQKIKRV